MIKHLTSFLFALMVILAGDASAQKISQLTGNYDATGTVSCTRTDSNEQFTCAYGVIRSQSERVEMHILSPTSYKRVLLFSGDAVTSPDEEVKVDARKEGDLWIITYNKREVYRIPVNAING